MRGPAGWVELGDIDWGVLASRERGELGAKEQLEVPGDGYESLVVSLRWILLSRRAIELRKVVWLVKEAWLWLRRLSSLSARRN